jgi:hypothetical protein
VSAPLPPSDLASRDLGLATLPARAAFSRSILLKGYRVGAMVLPCDGAARPDDAWLHIYFTIVV